MPRPKRKLNAAGGYDSWANSLAKRWGISRKELEQGDYDYKRYYNSNPSAARGHLTGDHRAHFPDTYKLPNHPTFSKESIYSGHNGNVVGGMWVENPNAAQRWTYQLSPEQIAANWNIRRTLEYAGDAEDEGFRVVDYKGRYPVINGVIDNGILPVVNVVRDKKKEGGSAKYIVQKGNSPWQIAHDNNISLDEFYKLNPNAKTMIHPGDVLRLAPDEVEERVNVRQRRALEDEFNADNMSAIQNFKHDGNYIVIDKKNKQLSVFTKDNQLLYKTDDIYTGLSGNDYNTITKIKKLDNGKTVLDNYAGNNSTPAGISYIAGVSEYHGHKSFWRHRLTNGKLEDIASSIHSTLGNEDKNKRNITNGCVRVNGKDLDNISEFVGAGTPIYTLPENNESRFVLRGGSLNFVSDNPYGEEKGDKRFWDDYNINIDKDYYPLILKWSKSGNERYDNNKKQFAQGIVENKERLQKHFNLSSDEYNRLAELALGIAEQETKFGTSKRYKLKRSAGDALIDIAKWLSGNTSVNSHGITQMKLEADNEDLKNIYNAVGIDTVSVNNPYKSAIATMLRLAYMYNNEIKGRKFIGADNKIVDAYDALLYKWNGHNEQLTKHLATPEKNIYLSNVKKYKNNFDLYETRKYKKYNLGGNIRRSLKYGGIYIKPENRGKFTETMRRTGKTAEELSHSSNPLTRKRAIFALNARKWHH